MQDFYSPRRKYKRKDAGPEDEKTRVRITLLEYGDKGMNLAATNQKSSSASKSLPDDVAALVDDAESDAATNGMV